MCETGNHKPTEMDSRIITSLEELSQILGLAGISSSQEEHILTIVRILSTSPKDTEELKSYEPCLQEDQETSIDHCFQSTKEAEDSWMVSVGEKPLELEIEELLICLYLYISCNQETNYSNKKVFMAR